MKKKVCVICNKPFVCGKRYGRARWTKTCSHICSVKLNKIQIKDWDKANKDKKKISNLKWREKNKEKYNEYQNAYAKTGKGRDYHCNYLREWRKRKAL